MESGIIGADGGYAVLVDGQPRTFRDVEVVAYEAPRFLKIASKYKERVEIVDRATKQRIEV
jgi:hypothetical protein